MSYIDDILMKYFGGGAPAGAIGGGMGMGPQQSQAQSLQAQQQAALSRIAQTLQAGPGGAQPAAASGAGQWPPIGGPGASGGPMPPGGGPQIPSLAPGVGMQPQSAAQQQAAATAALPQSKPNIGLDLLAGGATMMQAPGRAGIGQVLGSGIQSALGQAGKDIALGTEAAKGLYLGAEGAKAMAGAQGAQQQQDLTAQGQVGFEKLGGQVQQFGNAMERLNALISRLEQGGPRAGVPVPGVGAPGVPVPMQQRRF